MSYISLILLGIGALKKDGFLIASQIIILGIPYVFWNIDFYYYLINGRTLFGIVDYFFVPGSFIGKLISSQHLFTIPVSLYSLYLIKLKRNDFWKVSFLQVAAVFFVTRLATSPEKNVNCVFKSCTNFNFGLPYILEWFLVYFAMVLFANLIINRIKIFTKN